MGGAAIRKFRPISQFGDFRSNAPINVKPAGWRGVEGIGQGLDRLFWPGGRAFELSCCPGGRAI